MSKAGKLIKDMVKSKKESVMGKLGDAPYEDPMEPWSSKYAQPVKEDTLNEDGLLMKYIRSLGFNPEFMTFAQRSSYARSNAFKRFKTGHTFDREKQNLKQEETVEEEVEQIDEAGTGLLMSFIKSKGLNPLTMDGNQKKAYARSSEFKIFKMRHVKEVSGMGERGDDWNEEKKQVKEEADAKDVVSMDIPLLIRVLEFIREDVKTDMDLHRVVENLIDLRTEGVLSMDHYDKAVKINMKEEVSESLSGYNKHKIRVKVSKDGGEKHHVDMKVFANSESEAKGVARLKLKQKGYDTHSATHQGIDTSWLKKEEVEQIEELSSDLLGRYKKAAGAQASAADKAGDVAKGNKRFSGIMKATRKQFDNDDKKINELKNIPDNMDGDDHITREEKKMKGADPCWKGYQMVGTKKKGGRTVPNCVPEQVQEGIGGIEDSPMSATNSVKAMESQQRKKNMKSARIIKSIYKKKAKNETTYDWEKDDKPGAKVTLQGGTTMTGKPRDTVEIEPVLNTKTRPNSQKQ
jgi:hypothetical protein